MTSLPPIAPGLERLFGRSSDPIEMVAQRVALLDEPVIVWEGDAATFQFTYVGSVAERLLGYPARRWTDEPTFWADVIIEPADRNDAIAYCALATAKVADHVFEYRARAADGRVVWLRDYVRVVVGARRIPVRLRGLMFDITAERRDATQVEPSSRNPSRASLEAMAGPEAVG